jgi:putative flippase GtrA
MLRSIDIARLLKTSPRMLLVSGVSYAMNLSVFALLVKLAQWPAELAATAGIVAVMAFNFLALRYFIFRAARHESIWRQLALFLASTASFRVAELAAFSLIYRTFHADSLVVYPLVLAVSYIAKYVVAGHLIFRPPSPQTDSEVSKQKRGYAVAGKKSSGS